MLGKLWPFTQLFVRHSASYDLGDFNQRLEHFGIFRDKCGAVAAKYYLATLEGPAVCFDVGGNLGAFSRGMSVQSAKLYIFEPNNSLWERVHSVCEGLDYELVSAAVSDTSRVVSFVYHPNHTGAGRIGAQSGDGSEKLLQVDAISLDDFVRSRDIRSCAFIKIDVEGHELEVLDGARELIARFRPAMCLEVERADDGFVRELRKRLPSYQFFALEIPGYEHSPLVERVVRLAASAVRPRLRVDELEVDCRFHPCVFAIAESDVPRFRRAMSRLEATGVVLD